MKKKASQDKHEYTTQIQDIKDDTLLVLTPMYKSAMMRLQKGTELEMLVLDSGKIHSVFGKAGDTIIEGSLYYTEIKVIDVTKIERRSYFRVKIMTDMRVREKIKQDLTEELSDEEFFDAITIDLSGGGVQFSSMKSFKKNTIIEMKLGIDDRELLLEGEVLNRVEQLGLASYKHMVKFINLDTEVRELIVRYVFKIQREKLRR